MPLVWLTTKMYQNMSFWWACDLLSWVALLSFYAPMGHSLGVTILKQAKKMHAKHKN